MYSNGFLGLNFKDIIFCGPRISLYGVRVFAAKRRKTARHRETPSKPFGAELLGRSGARAGDEGESGAEGNSDSQVSS